MSLMLFVHRSAQIRALLEDMTEWADSILFSAIDLPQGESQIGLFPIPEPHLHKVERAVVTLRGSLSPRFLAGLEARGVLRVAEGDQLPMHLVIAQRDGQRRILLGNSLWTPGEPVFATYADVDDDHEMAQGARMIQQRSLHNARVVSRRELESVYGARALSTIVRFEPVSTVVAAIPHDAIEGKLVALSDGLEVERAFAALCEGVDVAPIAIRKEWCRRGPLWIQPGDDIDHWVLELRTSAPHAKDSSPQLQLSVPTEGSHEHAGLFFAREEDTGRLLLLHRGAFAGQTADEAELFWATTRYGRVEVEDGGKVVSAAPVCRLDSTDLPNELFAFACEIRRLRGEQPDPPVLEEPLSVDDMVELGWGPG